MSTNRPTLVPVDTIVGMLRDAADRLAAELLPAGRREGAEWVEACTSRGGLGDSLRVHIGPGPRRGVWAHFAAGQSGDALDLIAYLRTRGDKGAAIAWAKAWLGLEGADAATLQRHQARTAQAAAKASHEAEVEAAQRRNAAHAMYLAAQPIAGTPVERYLEGRGLAVRRLGFPLNALRYHPGLHCPITNRKWPGMVAAITGPDGKFLATHRTFLEVQADGRVTKAPIFDAGGKPQAKRVLGGYRGGTIRLWRGTVTDPATGEIKQARRLSDCKSGVVVDITEGIEDGLSVALADNEARVLVAISVANMAAIKLPECVETIALWRQNDPLGSEADQAVRRAIAAWQAQGKRVADLAPPEGVKDVNEMAQANAVRLGGAA